MTPETWKPDIPESAEKERAPRRIVRAVLVAPIPVSDLIARLSALGEGNIDQISFAEVLLIKKNERSGISQGLVMPVGGELKSGETATSGVLREVAEEVTVTSFSEREVKKNWGTDDTKGYSYAIQSYDTPRSVKLYLLPVQSSSFSMHEPREHPDRPTSEDKIAKMVHLSPSAFRHLVEDGRIDYHGESIVAAGVTTKKQDERVKISDENRRIRDQELDQVVSGIDDFDRGLKEGALSVINQQRVRKREALVDSLVECTHSEILSGFVGYQLRLALSDEAQNERSSGPHKKIGLLRALPYLVSELPAEEFTNLLYALPNRESQKAAVQFEKSFVRGASEIISHFRDQVSVESDLRRGTSSEREDTMRRLIDVWPDFLKLSTSDRIKLLEKANDATISTIMELTGINDLDIAEALSAVNYFHNSITEEMKAGDYEAFQEFRPMNELMNASIFTRMIFALGMHPHVEVKNQGQSELSKLRLESLRSLASFNVALEVAKQIREARIDHFQAALDAFFEFPPKNEMTDLGGGRLHTVNHRTTNTPINGRFMHVLVDERDKKTVISGMRKRFLSPNLDDIFSINFVLADDNFAKSTNPIGDRIQTALELREVLLDHVRNALGEEWDVTVKDGEYKRGSIEKAENIGNLRGDDNQSRAEEHKGKRAGSKGDAILREKFILLLRGPIGIEEKLELSIYPFESVETEGMEVLKEKGFWGFDQKLLDDYEGTYKAKRVFERDIDEPTKPSLFELLYPPRFYGPQSQRAREKHVLPRRSSRLIAP